MTNDNKKLQDLINKPITSITDAGTQFNEIFSYILTPEPIEYKNNTYKNDDTRRRIYRYKFNKYKQIVPVITDNDSLFEKIINFSVHLHEIEMLKNKQLGIEIEKLKTGDELKFFADKKWEERQNDWEEDRENLINSMAYFEERLSMIDKYFNSGFFPVLCKENEWIYLPHKFVSFNHTETFTKIELINRMLELFRESFEIASRMRQYLLKYQINRLATDFAITIMDVQEKLFILQEAFFVAPITITPTVPMWGVRSTDFIADFPKENLYVNRLRDMKLSWEKINKINQFICQHIFEEAKKRTDGNQIVSNAVVNAYWFQCLEWELIVQFWTFIKQIKNWKANEETALIRIGNDIGEFEVYDAENEEGVRMITIPLLRQLLDDLSREVGQQRGEILIKNLPLSDDGKRQFLLNWYRQRGEELPRWIENYDELPIFHWKPNLELEKEWEEPIKEIELRRELLAQIVKIDERLRELDKKWNCY